MMNGVERAQNPDRLGSLQSLLATVIIAIFVITFVVQAFQIPSESMENTLLIGDYLLVDKLRYGTKHDEEFIPYRRIKRGDIIVFKYPVNPTQHFVKRVIGLPGDHLRLMDRKVYINGNPVRESYVRYSSHVRQLYRDDFPRLDTLEAGVDGNWWLQMKKLVEDDQLIVPEGNYFVMGDNRDESSDSRYWGFVPRENVIGRPLLIYWSVRSTDQDLAVSSTAGDRLYHFAYALTHLFQITRWDRTFRVIK